MHRKQLPDWYYHDPDADPKLPNRDDIDTPPEKGGIPPDEDPDQALVAVPCVTCGDDVMFVRGAEPKAATCDDCRGAD